MCDRTGAKGSRVIRANAPVRLLAAAALTVWGGMAVAAEPPRQAPGIPARPADAPSGAEFAAKIWTLRGAAREEAVLSELTRGNVPPFLRELKPVELSYESEEGTRLSAVIWVMPDYLAVGSDEDFLRIPMGLPTALKIADRFGLTLPTRKMVDAAYEQAGFRFTPQPMKRGRSMTSTAYFTRHNTMIEQQRRGHALGILMSGHKKDVVLTKRLWTRRGKVAIYGWHRGSGRAIQPLSTIHGARYADYSHGIRLVARTCLVNGEPMSIFDVLEDPALAPVLAYEGAIRDAAALMTPGRPARPR